jgi:MSHA pilin protein MshC
MCARFSRPRAQRGFTLIELVTILILVGVLAAVVMPKFDTALSLRNDAARDEALGALRYAGQTAQSHRRLVCADVSATAVTLRIASARPASTCGSALNGPNGGSAFTANAGAATFTLSPSGTMYFQPDGRVTSDGAGATVSARTMTISGANSLSIGGETGLVR